MSLQQAFGDAQTTIASLAAGIGGVASDSLASFAIAQVGAQSQGVGALGLEFCFRAVVSAGCFGLLHSQMPETSNNIFFSILYFAGDRGLMMSAVALSRALVSTTTSAVKLGSVRTGPSRAAPSKNPTVNPTPCGSGLGSCNGGGGAAME